MNPKPYFLRFLFFFFLTVLCTTCPAEEIVSKDGYDPRLYATIVRQYVDPDGKVNYSGMQKNRNPLDAYLKTVAELVPASFSAWAEKERLAFWINVYNALTLKAILDHYPIQASFLRSLRYPQNSIQQIPGVWDTIQFTVMGREMTLQEIEQEVLREPFHEPRVRIALVCAACGCPPLRAEPYRANQLEEQFTNQVHRMLNQEELFQINSRGRIIYLPQWFEWHGDEFLTSYHEDNQPPVRSKKQKAVIQFLAQYAEKEIREALLSYQYRVGYLDFDWSLNEQAKK